MASSLLVISSATDGLRSVPPAAAIRIQVEIGSGSVQSVRMGGGSATLVESIVVYVTVPNKEAGKKLAESIIKERLAACVNRVPGIESVYHSQARVPEVIALPILGGNDKYLEWIKSSTRD